MISMGSIDMGKHTPGPWTMTTVNTSSGICHKVGPFPWKHGKQNHACIYADYPSHTGVGPLEDELSANARLIASAPELLAALQGLLRRAKDELADPEDVHEVHVAELAIARATGEAP
jgi:hypothetical protein